MLKGLLVHECIVKPVALAEAAKKAIEEDRQKQILTMHTKNSIVHLAWTIRIADEHKHVFVFHWSSFQALVTFYW